MSKRKLRALVVCPGRGTYNRNELGYLANQHGYAAEWLQRIDNQRRQAGAVTLQMLDSAPVFKSREHLAATNAAPLIYACSYHDFTQIALDRFEVVAVTGNSMGWYTALACAGALSAEQGGELVTGMAELTGGSNLGGQLIYPEVNEAWQPDAERSAAIAALLQHHDADKRLYRSIRFGGYQVLAGSTAAIQHAVQTLPPVDDRYPLVLPGHSAFHTELMANASAAALTQFPVDFFQCPTAPLIDGRGVVWQPLGTDIEALRQYTLVQQVCETYDFSRAVVTGVKEFAPDVIILNGPGGSMGGAVAQALIAEQWHGMRSKADFIGQQQSALKAGKVPYIISLGMPDQRPLAVL